MLETSIIRPLPSKISENDCRKYGAVYEKIRDAVQQLDKAQQELRRSVGTGNAVSSVSFSQFSLDLGLSW
jgi:hypothetical protein